MCGLSEGGVSVDTEDPVRVVTLSVEEVMKDEWEQMRAENSALPFISHHRKRGFRLVDASGMPNWKSSCATSHCVDDEFEVSNEPHSGLLLLDSFHRFISLVSEF